MALRALKRPSSPRRARYGPWMHGIGAVMPKDEISRGRKSIIYYCFFSFGAHMSLPDAQQGSACKISLSRSVHPWVHRVKLLAPWEICCKTSVLVARTLVLPSDSPHSSRPKVLVPFTFTYRQRWETLASNVAPCLAVSKQFFCLKLRNVAPCLAVSKQFFCLKLHKSTELGWSTLPTTNHKT